MFSQPSFYFYYPHYQPVYFQPSIVIPTIQQPITYPFFSQNLFDQTNRNLNGNAFFNVKEQPKLDQTLPAVKLESQLDQSAKQAQKKKQLKDLATSKKNGESNIINRFFTFFQNQHKSKPILQQIINRVTLSPSQTRENVIQAFYSIIILLSTTQKRTYVNRKNIIDLARPQTLVDKLCSLGANLDRQTKVSFDTLTKVFRLCIHIFIKKWSLLSIINSRRISITSKKQYLRRRRQIQRQLTNSIKYNKKNKEQA